DGHIVFRLVEEVLLKSRSAFTLVWVAYTTAGRCSGTERRRRVGRACRRERRTADRCERRGILCKVHKPLNFELKGFKATLLAEWIIGQYLGDVVPGFRRQRIPEQVLLRFPTRQRRFEAAVIDVLPAGSGWTKSALGLVFETAQTLPPSKDFLDH